MRKKFKPKARYLVMAAMLSVGWLSGGLSGLSGGKTLARSCPDVVGVFARGSGEERGTGINYLSFKETLAKKLKTTGLSYDFVDLNYPAVGIDFGVAIGAIFSGGGAYEFGESRNKGVAELKRVVDEGCANTKYVIGGYSQGAMVVIKALPNLDSERVIYAATFGDPKLYLPEGFGATPAACAGKNLSNYRMYVPDCFAYSGKLGASIPYQPAEYIDKLGTWCNKHDIMCSPYLSLAAHTSYVADNLYEDAARRIFEKITEYFGIENQFYVPHDTAILIDSTGSMAGMIDTYKAEALRLARETLENGGRVALYDYRDLDDPYEPVRHCDFESCDLAAFTAGLDEIEADGGGDGPESLLSAAYRVMRELNWKVGSTKSLVVLTDATYLSPDRDGTAFDEVVKLSKRIDPVNFYVITDEWNVETYGELAEATGGRAVTIGEDLSLLTDEIMARSDSLPRVEEADVFGYGGAEDTPTLNVLEVKDLGGSVKIYFENTGVSVMVSMNDAPLGMATSDYVIIEGLDRTVENRIVLTPLSEVIKGEEKEVVLEPLGPTGLVASEELVVPGVPNTGIPDAK